MLVGSALRRGSDRLAGAVLLLCVCMCDADTTPTVATLLSDADGSFGRGEYSAAIRIYGLAIDLDPKASLLYTKRAAAYIASRQGSLALRDLNSAIEQDNTFTTGYIHRGKVHRQMCNTVSAKNDFAKVLELKPGHKTATSEMALVGQVEGLLAIVTHRFEANQLDGKEAELQQLFDIAQDCTPAQLLEARLAMRREDWEQVIAITGRLLKVGGVMGFACMGMRGACMGMGGVCMGIIRGACMGMRGACMGMRDACMGMRSACMGMIAGMQPSCRFCNKMSVPCAQADPSNLPALVARGQGYFYAGDDDLAKRHFGEALNHDPDYKDARDAFNKVG